MSCRCHPNRRSLLTPATKSKVPEGGWTMENFRTPAGVALVMAMDRAMRMGKQRGMRTMAKALAPVMKRQVELVIDQFERNLANQHGIRKSWVPFQSKATVTIQVQAHADLWAAAIEQVMREQGAPVIAAISPAMHAAAEEIHDATSVLLGHTPHPAASRVLRTRTDDIARQVTRINTTTRTRLASTIQKGIDAGKHPFEVMAMVRKRIPEIATNRVPTIVRTEMSRVADASTIRAMRDSTVVTHVSVTGCEAVEPGIPTWNGIPTCNIRNVPIASAGDLRFHINHTGSIVASGFKTARGGTPDLRPRIGGGAGTWEDNGSPVPAIIEDPVPPIPPRPPAPLQRPIQTPEPPVPPPSLPDPPPAPPTPDIDDLHPPVRQPVNHLGRIQAPTTDDGWADLEIEFEQYAGHAIYRHTTRRVVEEFGMTPKQLAQKLDGSLRTLNAAQGGGGTVKTSISSDYSGITIEHKFRSATSRVDATRIINTGEKWAKHDFFGMSNELQKTGVAKKLLSDYLTVYDHLGIETIKVDANIDVGGYAWAKYGFLPKSQETWLALREIMVEKLDELVESGRFIDTNHPASVIDGIIQILDSDDRMAIRAVADLKLPVAPAIRFKPDGTRVPDLPLGKALLMNRYWSGELDLTNPDHYAVFASYMGR